MAEQKRKSQAERAVSAAKSQKTTGKQSSATKKNEKSKTRNTDTNLEDVSQIPVRLITSIVCLGMFILFLVIFLEPEGALVKLIESMLLGLIGKVAFTVSIPALLYLFIIHAFSGKRPIRMRSICLIAFVLSCGCISHLYLSPEPLSRGFQVISELYNGGAQGTTGGVFCGGVAILVRWLLGTTISYILFAVAAVLTLLGAMQITVASIIRAVKNRPRAEWELEEREDQQEPAAIVVNHFAAKRIEYVEQQRIAKETRISEEPSSTVVQAPASKTAGFGKTKNAAKVSDMMRQIKDVEAPVAAAGAAVANVEEEDISVPPFMDAPRPVVSAPAAPSVDNPVTPEIIPKDMPAFEPDKPLVPAPVLGTAAQEAAAKITAKEARESAAQVALEIAQAEAEEKPAYCFPPIDLLKKSANGAADGTAEMRENSRRLNETLESFKIDAHIINVTRGPSVTRYEVELEKGVRLNKLTTVADDIALSLGASGVRIAAVPGKISVVGIEVPNRAVTMVSLREVIDSPEFSKAKSKSSFAVGKDIGGSCIVGNIARLPHMLIAGTTGSGKSVCMNSIIISLLYKASPEDVKLIMVDPKMVELGIYNGIPHLLIPVVTDPKKAAGSLQWAVTEMMRRYKAMSDAGVRDLESYNSIIDSQEVEGEKLPQVVVIIDELADLMLVAAKEVEESICRIAQMGRAAGIHLIIATQRPSADVITGLMKANIPSRIAFAVASAMESRIILDTQGAEKLVGKGDMLYAPIGNGKPKRVQGCFVSDPEVEAVATYVKENYNTNYDQNVMEEIERKAAQTGTKSAAVEPEPNADELCGDEMLPDAVNVILETGQASVSMLQRRLKLGYARAARIVDEMEEKGIVGPFSGSKPRVILITKEQWQAMRSGTPMQMDFDDLGTDEVPEEADI